MIQRVFMVGFPAWRAHNLGKLLSLHPESVRSVRDATHLPHHGCGSGDRVVWWGATPPRELVGVTQACGAQLLHVEDGFVRSVGLGSDLIRPQSLVLDERGLYFDATRASDLEHLLSHRAFTDDDLERARLVRAFIVTHGITKYNLEPREAVRWTSAGRRIVLVPGQVEDDASIRLGCTTVRTNLALLEAARSARPDAFIVYKPHPDVLSGNRRGRIALGAVRQWADHIEAHASVVSCIDACDEVHTMTSLCGFDALLRQKRVFTYGQPFYAGWGLTDDRAKAGSAFARRTRRLTLDELVSGALLHYPIYWDWTLNGYTTCEAVLRRIIEERTGLEANGKLQHLRSGCWRRRWRKAATLLRAWLE